MATRNQFFQSVIDLISLQDVVSEDTELTKVGGKLLGWHTIHGSASKKSLVLYADGGWYCWNCEEGGSVIDYVMSVKKMIVGEAITWLCDKYQIPNPKLSPEEQIKAKKLKAESEILERLHLSAANYYASKLTEKRRDYLTSRGLTEKTIEKYKIGYADGKLWSFFKYKEWKSEQLLLTGLFRHFDNSGVADIFVDRYIFPYFKHEKPVYFIGRRNTVTDEETMKLPEWNRMKYRKMPIHSEKYPYISELVSNQFFLGEDSVWDNNTGIVTEGVLDCILAIQSGFSCISPATTHFSKDQFERLHQLIKRWNDTLVIFDTDESGVSAAEKVTKTLFKKGIDIKVVNLPTDGNDEKVDLADFLRS